MIKIVVCYALALAVPTVIGVVLRLQLLKRGAKRRSFAFSSNVNDSTDKSVEHLCIESAGDLVSAQTLSKRGSWRVALNQVMPDTIFEDMKAEEYSKKL